MYRRYQCEYQFARDRDGVVVEPHWAFAQRILAINLNYEALFERSRRTILLGTPVSVHAPEDLLLVLCVHGGKHQWERLSWIRDVAALLERNADLDVELAMSRARAQGCTRLMLLGLNVAHRLLGAPLLPRILSTIQSNTSVQALTREVTRRLFSREIPPVENLWPNRFTFRLHDRTTSRLRYVACILLLPHREHIEMVAFPASLTWLYYPLRWIHDYVLLPLSILTRPLRTKRQSTTPVT
jgi:hypothetical protein